MTVFRKILSVLAASVMVLTFAACGASAPENAAPAPQMSPLPTASPTPALPGNIAVNTKGDRVTITDILSEDDLEKALPFLMALDERTGLSAVRFVSSTLSDASLRKISGLFPDAEIDCPYELAGRRFNLCTASLDLHEISHEDSERFAGILPCMRNLRKVDLGDDSSGLEWEDIRTFQKAAPDVRFEYAFTLYEKQFCLTDEKMSLHHIRITDEGELVRKVISCMPYLTYLDMDSAGVSNESMAAIRDDFPNIKLVWRIWFGENYSVRTDVEKILASNPGNGGNLTVSNTTALKYCNDVKYLDVGHNEILYDISFIKYMPKLEVAILAMDYFTDTTPIASCPELEFLEIQTNEITDLTPLSGLHKLKHLNIAHNYDLCDITPLYGLTQLERLWIGSIDPVPQEQVDEMQRRAPDCIINTEVWDPHAGNWRYDADRESGFSERYELLVQQFGYDRLDYSYYWMDPYYYEDGRIPWVYMDSVYDDAA